MHIAWKQYLNICFEYLFVACLFLEATKKSKKNKGVKKRERQREWKGQFPPPPAVPPDSPPELPMPSSPVPLWKTHPQNYSSVTIREWDDEQLGMGGLGLLCALDCFILYELNQYHMY